MKTVFLRALEPEHKAEALLAEISQDMEGTGITRFEIDPSVFRSIPGTPFAYWVSDHLRNIFRELPPLESLGWIARCGLATADDFRWLRLSWESTKIAIKSQWPLPVPFAKGGNCSPFYADLHLEVLWGENGRWIKEWKLDQLRLENITANNSKCWNESHYFRPGITWPLRARRFSPQSMPAGSIFSLRGYGLFSENVNDLSPYLALTNSKVFDYFFKIMLGRFGFPEFIVGVLMRIPVPAVTIETSEILSNLSKHAWSIKRKLDTRNETSHAFTLPALLQVEAPTLAQGAVAWTERIQSVEANLTAIQAEIDERCFDLYEIGEEDRRVIVEGYGESPLTPAFSPLGSEGESLDEGTEEEAEGRAVDAVVLAAELLSWAAGVAFGRFDLRLATGERVAPTEPEPVDPLPVYSPGILTGVDGMPVMFPPAGYPIIFQPDGILVDDVGHDRDLFSQLHKVFKTVFGKTGDAFWHESAELLDPRGRDLRAWLARSFFDEHLKRYSKSRRRAPIFWQLATPSASYSVWVYCHRSTRDTFFHVLNDHVDPKLRHEEGKLTRIQQEAGPNPSAGQRRALAEQESFVEELRALRQEVARVAPLWNPDLNDGVIINFSLLWRLIPQHRAWQRECRECWEKLVAGNYDWAHLAMHLWPERVVPKCADDRSLAISHGLEDEFWEEADGKWRKRQVTSARVNELVKERTSTAVQTALVDLLAAPATGSVNSRGRVPRRAAATQRPEPAQPKRPTIEGPPKDAPARRTEPASMDDTILVRVRDAIAQVASGASKSDVLTATGLSDTEWHRAVAALVDNGEVNRTGEKRSTRYHIADRKKG